MISTKPTSIKRQRANKCMACGNIMVGRSDKKFCDDRCRITYHNAIKQDRNNYMRNVNNALYLNRHILENMVTSASPANKITKEALLKKGFKFKYHTHTHVNKKGNTYFYCYDHGYLPLEDGQYLIVKQKNTTI